MTIAGRIIGRETPDLHHYHSQPDMFGSCPWAPPADTEPYFEDARDLEPMSVHDDDDDDEGTFFDADDSGCPEGGSLGTMTTAYSTKDERERSRERTRVINRTQFPVLPLTADGVREWAESIKWVLSSQIWCHHGTHAADITATTSATESLPRDFLQILKKAAAAHTSTQHNRTACSLLEDDYNGINGANLIARGQGFELYQRRVKPVTTVDWALKPS
jgi:hypothetical protein